ncbi:hypothetical protein ACVWWN_008397 [Mycobacterium sp. URHB0021]
MIVLAGGVVIAVGSPSDEATVTLPTRIARIAASSPWIRYPKPSPISPIDAHAIRWPPRSATTCCAHSIPRLRRSPG